MTLLHAATAAAAAATAAAAAAAAADAGDMAEQTVPTLFVYCDILEYVVVGDIMAPLLRMVDMKCKRTYGKMHETPAVPLSHRSGV